MSPSSDITVPFARDVIEAVKRVAADEIMPRYRSVVATRKDDGSLVTEADFASQRALVRKLSAIEAVPVMGEEMPRDEQLEIFEGAPRFWCVDPVDGTANFAAGIPYFAVSVALMEGGRPLFGTVYDPVADAAFYAVRGAGAWVDQRPLELGPAAPPLAQAHAEVSLRRDTKALRSAIKRHQPYGKRRTSGSSTLSWCDLAAGRIDAMLHSGQKMWDYAAGSLIFCEAGGALCTLESDDFWSAPAWTRSVIAARTPELLAEWRSWVRAHADQPSSLRT
ncbi:MAG TPA: inositol monophosphatase family protein [Usitatibacter sp.]|jgi:myo-inositol-1(or 4)-monophosphatase|nr:inositol monophosphatase family protein [Usitatibacter sp.]